MLDDRLIKAINKGRCFALVGAGPSCELNYPSWHELAEKTYNTLAQNGVVIDAPSYEKFLKRKAYPELFRQAELDIGSRDDLLDLLKTFLVPTPGQPAAIYDLLAKWPFACYLTTNYDDEISNALRCTGQYYSTLRNWPKDFHAIRDGTSHLIVKLHSDLDHPNEVILTSEDYRRVSTGPKFEYYRAKLRQMFEMFDILIVGHSLTDPDISLILQIAKETACPEHPVYFIGADLTAGEIREYHERFNIVAANYSNADGTHQQLRRLLATADKFIPPRAGRFEAAQGNIPETEIEAASSILIFRRLQSLRNASEVTSFELLAPVILHSLRTVGDSGGSIDDLLAATAVETITRTEDFRQESIKTLNALVELGFVRYENERYALSDKGLDQVELVAATRRREEDQAYGQFAVTLQQAYPGLSAGQQDTARVLLKSALVRVFKSRGLAIANSILVPLQLNISKLG